MYRDVFPEKLVKDNTKIVSVRKARRSHTILSNTQLSPLSEAINTRKADGTSLLTLSRIKQGIL